MTMGGLSTTGEGYTREQPLLAAAREKPAQQQRPSTANNKQIKLKTKQKTAPLKKKKEQEQSAASYESVW